MHTHHEEAPSKPPQSHGALRERVATWRAARQELAQFAPPARRTILSCRRRDRYVADDAIHYALDHLQARHR